MNTLLCIGCDAYDFLLPLRGAEGDARAIIGFLKDDVYAPCHSKLLLSPANLEMKNALDDAFPAGEEIDIFTFFFAGHGCVKAGSFYLCAKDSSSDRLSTTAFPITSLFAVINEFHPRQANIIVDACQAGGSSFDLGQLAKSEIIGSSQSSSITFLGACSADQFAGESDKGGFLTVELSRCLTGEREVQTKLPFLDLIEVGAVVCRAVCASHPEQKPVAWGLSLFGTGGFARNPHYDAGRIDKGFPSENVRPQSAVGASIRSHSPALWDEYRAMQTNPDPRRLLDLLQNILRGAGEDVADAISFLRGLSATLIPVTLESSELLAPSQCLATCALSLLPWIESDRVKGYVRDVLRQMLALDYEGWSRLSEAIAADDHALLSEIGAAAELYYLPLRVTKTLGWIGLSSILGKLLPDLKDGHDQLRFELVSQIVGRYSGTIVSVSDEQAPYVYVFLKACLLSGKRDLAESVINNLFASYVEKCGNVTRLGTDGVQAFRYISSLGPEQYRPGDWRPANPSQLLAVLLLAGANLGLDEMWSLRPLDRKTSVYFIPSNYREFGKKIIEEGVNYTNQMGFGIWSLHDFAAEFGKALKKSFSSRAASFLAEEAALCTVASLLFPDRLPLLLEDVLAMDKFQA